MEVVWVEADISGFWGTRLDDRIGILAAYIFTIFIEKFGEKNADRNIVERR